VFGVTVAGLLDAQLPIAGMAGDQQAALFGQACFEPGMAKSTYGTGCFMLVNTGAEAIASQHRLLTTPAYRLGGKTTFALEGSIFVAGAAVKWLREGLGVLADASETHSLATAVPDSHGVYMVPAFVGLGAPYWDPDARGAIFGLTLDATGAHLARAALEAVAYQTLDLAEAMSKDRAAAPAGMRVDGGMASNAWLCQFLADILQVPVERPQELETTALGAAFLAGLATGVWASLEELSAIWNQRDCFRPTMPANRRQSLIDGWRSAVAKTLTNQAARLG
jgi:glycerol kinase